MATAHDGDFFLPDLPALPVDSGRYQRRRDGLVALLDALYRLHLPVAPADFPGHVLGILATLLPGYEWSFVPADQNGDGPASDLAFAEAVLGPPLGKMILHATPRLSGALRQRADILLRGLAPHVALVRTSHSPAPITGGNGPFSGSETPLTRREQDVLRWMGEGKRDGEIATILGISPRTVHKHVQNLLQKLGAETRTAAVRNSAGRGPATGRD